MSENEELELADESLHVGEVEGHEVTALEAELNELLGIGSKDDVQASNEQADLIHLNEVPLEEHAHLGQAHLDEFNSEDQVASEVNFDETVQYKRDPKKQLNHEEATRQLALKYKQAGDIEGAKDLLRMLKQMSPLVQQQAATTGSKKTMKGDELAEVLEEQIAKALRISRYYASHQQPSFATSFKGKAAAMFEEREGIEASRVYEIGEIPVAYDMSIATNPEIKPDELIIQLSKFSGLGDLAFAIQASIGDLTKQSEVCKNGSFVKIRFTGLTRDIRLTKLLEHRKLRLELFRPKGGLFSIFGAKKLEPTGHSAAVSLGALLSASTHFESGVQIKPTAGGPTFDLTVQMQKPATGKSSVRMRESWITSRINKKQSEGKHRESKQTDIKQSDHKQPERKLSDSKESGGTLSGMIPAPQLVFSLTVLEAELERLGALPEPLRSNPEIVERQLAVEQARDDLSMRAQLGTLTPEAYLKGLQDSLTVFKQGALQAKRSSDLPLAKAFLSYAKLIEEELKEEE